MNRIKTFFFLFICIILLNGCSSENATSKVKEDKNVESEENNKASEVKELRKPFNFTIDEFVSAYNEVDSSFENKKINFDEIGDFEQTEIASGQIYTKELLNEIDDPDGTFNLQAWHDHDKNFYRLHIFTTGSENIASEQGMRNTLAVLHILGIDFKHLNDFLYNDEEELNIIDGDYSVQLTKIPSMSLILNIEPK